MCRSRETTQFPEEKLAPSSSRLWMENVGVTLRSPKKACANSLLRFIYCCLVCSCPFGHSELLLPIPLLPIPMLCTSDCISTALPNLPPLSSAVPLPA